MSCLDFRVRYPGLIALQSTASFARDPTIGNATATKNKIEDVIGSKTEPIAKGTNLYSNEVVRTGDASCMRLRQLQTYAT